MITYLLHKNYRFSSAVKYWVRSKFTAAGGMVLGAAIVAAGIGVDTQQAIAYQAFILLALMLLLAFFWSLFPTPKLAAERILPRVGTAGQPLIYRLSVSNPGSRVQSGLTVMEDFGDPRPTYREFANTPEPGERKRNPFDRFFRFYRWMWLIARKELATSVPARVPSLKPGRSEIVELELLPKKRGNLRLAGMKFAVTDPFGLCRSYSQVSAPQSVLILPKRYVIPAISIGGASQYQPGGVSLAAALGNSDEFMSVREYRRGDPLRHIHWKSTSKTGKLIVKEFQSEYFVRQALILDTFLEDSSSPVFEEAISIAASFALTLNTQDSLLDLLFVGPEAYAVTAGHGVAQVEHMLEILASVQPCVSRGFSELRKIVLRQVGQVSGCVSIFLKWDAQRQELVERIASAGVPQLVLILKKPGQKNPEVRLENDRQVQVKVVEAGNVQDCLNQI